MAYAIELFFDETSDKKVRLAWDACGPACGVPNYLLTIPSRPHVSLAVLADTNEKALLDLLGGLANRHAVFPLRLDSVGMFATAEGVLFLGPAPSHALLEMHRNCIALLDELEAQVSEYYQRDRLVFHCALNMHLNSSDIPKAVSASLKLDLPILANVVEVGLVRLPQVELVKAFKLQP